jgi:hypothetical protein
MAAKRPDSSGIAQPDLLGVGSHLDLRPYKTVRLAVTGDVALNRLEVRLIDTPDFQRLRHIRQLAAACWVYPTALHTRFDHSLGTLGMTDTMIQTLRANMKYPVAWREVSPEQELLARLLALLHDITHIPFGHTIEDECCVFPRHDRDAARLDRFLGGDSPIGRILLDQLGRELYDRLAALFRADLLGEPGDDDDRFILDMVTGALGADLLDYLRRDAFFCNMGLDTDYRFLRSQAIVAHEGRRRLIVRLWKEGAAHPRRDVLHELIRLLDNRYLLGERVYYHHAKLVAGAMIAAAVARAHAAGLLALEELFGLGDDVLLWRLRTCDEPAARRLAEAIATRRLWKTVHVLPYTRIRAGRLGSEQDGNEGLEMLMTRFHRDAPARMAEEDRLAARLGLDPGDILIHCPHHQMAMKSATTLVYWDGDLRSLKDCGDDPLIGARLQAILDSHQHLWSLRVFANPGRLEEPTAAAIAEACEALLTG